MTYNELAEYIKKLSPAMQETEVIVFSSGAGEFYTLADDYPIVEIDITEPASAVELALGQGRPYLVI